MRKSGRWVKRFLGVIFFCGFFAATVIWAYVLVNDPKLTSGLKELIAPLSALGVWGLFAAKLTKYNRETGSCSAALTRLIWDEWLVPVFFLLVVLLTILQIVATMPVYKVVVSVRQSPVASTDPESVPWSLSPSHLFSGIPVSVLLKSPDQPFEVSLKLEDLGESFSIKRSGAETPHFESRRLLHWGQKSSIIVKTQEHVKISIRTQPPSLGTKIEVSAPPHYDTLDGKGDLTIEKGNVLQLLVTAKGYKAEPRIYDDLNENTTIIVAYADKMSLIPEPSDSNTRVITMNPLSGTVSFEIFNEGGDRIENMTVYISRNERLLTGKSCRHRFQLEPGDYWVYIKEDVEIGSEDYAEVRRFPISISPGQDTVIQCTARLH